MSLTGTKQSNTITKSTPRTTGNGRLIEVTLSTYRTFLTNNSFFTNNKRVSVIDNSILTYSGKIKERVDTYLTDSWQIASLENMTIKHNRVAKWFEAQDGCADTRKYKHTQLTKANYYSCIEN